MILNPTQKITTYAFSGGKETVEEHRLKGGDPDVDVSYQYLRYFMEDDDELQRIYDAYKKGEMLTGELKGICIKYLQEYVQKFQVLRAKVTEEVVDEFMAVRPLSDCKGNPEAPLALPIRAKAPAGDAADGANAQTGDAALSKNALKKLEKEKQVAAKKAAKAAEKEAAKAAEKDAAA